MGGGGGGFLIVLPLIRVVSSSVVAQPVVWKTVQEYARISQRKLTKM